MQYIGAAIGLLIILGCLIWVGAFILTPFAMIPEYWRQVHYTRHGKCPEKHCHLEGRWKSYYTDSLYGSTKARVLVCPKHGEVGAPSGDRRAVNW